MSAEYIHNCKCSNANAWNLHYLRSNPLNQTPFQQNFERSAAQKTLNVGSKKRMNPLYISGVAVPWAALAPALNVLTQNKSITWDWIARLGCYSRAILTQQQTQTDFEHEIEFLSTNETIVSFFFFFFFTTPQIPKYCKAQISKLPTGLIPKVTSLPSCTWYAFYERHPIQDHAPDACPNYKPHK